MKEIRKLLRKEILAQHKKLQNLLEAEALLGDSDAEDKASNAPVVLLASQIPLIVEEESDEVNEALLGFYIHLEGY